MSFFQKPIGATLLLGTALGTPYVLFETESGTQLRQAVSSGSDSIAARDPGIPPAPTSFPQSAAIPNTGMPYTGMPNTGMLNAGQTNQSPFESVVDPRMQQALPTLIAQPPIDLRQVIRFDISPDFVYRNFPRVSTVLSELNYDGLRVPLVSGTQAHDVAGSLTYYFDINKNVRRIQFQGVTGDATPLTQLMIQHYRLNPERSLGGQLLTMRWNNRVTSFIHIAPAPVVSAQQPNARFAFFMEINKPSEQYGLSNDATAMLQQAQAAQRW